MVLDPSSLPPESSSAEQAEIRSKGEPQRHQGARIRRDDDMAIRTVLVLAILAVYAQTALFSFTNYDDPLHVSAIARTGLNLGSLQWALTAVVVSNWMPVTLFTHIMDCQLFGAAAGMHHLVNVVFHILASLLLFEVLRRATGSRWPSAFVALMFALHPLHVESVAWIAERKDVLSALFWFLALYAYVVYTEAPSRQRYLMVAVPFCLGLMSKPMLVTFPFTLMLFDVWPLRRARFPETVWEKLPLLVLSAAASAVTYSLQQSTGAFSQIPLGVRLENALLSYVIYVGKMFWPTRLAAFYPYRVDIPIWQPAAALVVLLTVSALAIHLRRSKPYFIVGWCWFLGTLVPVIGLVQAGAQSRADRYTYIPMVGLLWVLGWAAADLVKARPRMRPVMPVIATFCCLACMVLSWKQVTYWQNGVTRFEHAVQVTEHATFARANLAKAHYYQGCELAETGRSAEAIDQFQAALRNNPNLAEAHNNLGMLLAGTPFLTADAMAHYETAIRLNPNLAQAHLNLAALLASQPGRVPEAIAHLEAAQRIQPNPKVQQAIDGLRQSQRSAEKDPVRN